MLNKKVVVIGGATASGKSSYAMQLAQRCDGVIINGDSLQVYDALPILTAHPTAEDKNLVDHKLYGFLPVSAHCNVSTWHQIACDEIDLCHNQGKLPIVVGGTGMYLDTLKNGIAYVPEINPAIREDVRAMWDTIGSSAFYEKLHAIDTAYAAKLHPNDMQRLLRAYETMISTGQSLLEWQRCNDTKRIHRYEVEKVIINRSRQDLHARAIERLQWMLKNGALDEVQQFLHVRENAGSTICKAIGVREIASYLDKQCSYDYMQERLYHATCQYIKRQMTWFNRSFRDATQITLGL